MVEVTFTGKCKKCPNFEPYVEKLYSDDRPLSLAIECMNHPLCNHLEQYLKVYLKSENAIKL